MIGNIIWTPEFRAKLLHILPQVAWHQPAQIRGSPEALVRLALALMRASKMKQGEHTAVDMLAADGESYDVIIHPMSDEQMDAGPLPYAELRQP
jgi:hypothetical protein